MRRLLLGLIVCASIAPRGVRAGDHQCPLVDRQGYDELLNSVEVLGQELSKVQPGCADSAQLEQLMEAQKRLRESTGQLRQFWENPTLASSDATTFNSQLTLAMGSASAIGDAIGNSTFIKSPCGQQVQQSGRILVAVNEVLTNFGPLALLGLTVAKVSFAAAGPVFLGVAGISTVVRVWTSLDKDKVDMSNPSNRLLVLKGACEYTRIHRRIRFLTAVRENNVNKLRTELRARYKEIYDQLSPELRDKVEGYRTQSLALESAWKAVTAEKLEYRRLATEFASLGTSQEDRCAFPVALAETRVKDQFPFAVSSRSRRLLSEGVRSLPAIKPDNVMLAYWSSNERLEREVFAKLPEMKGAMAREQCANFATAWMESIGKVLNQTERQLSRLQNEMQKSLAKDAMYPEWKKQISNVESERVLLDKLFQAIGTQSIESRVVSDSELSMRVRGLQAMLFGRESFLNFSRGRSPVGAWLEYVRDNQQDRLAEFEGEFERIDRDAFDMVRRLPPERRPHLPNEKILNWQLLTEKYFPAGQKGRKLVCQRAERMIQAWTEASDHLGAAELFCKTIRPVIDDTMDPVVVNVCAGRESLSDRRSSPSVLEKIRLRMGKGSALEKKAEIVRQKQREFACPGPQAGGI